VAPNIPAAAPLSLASMEVTDGGNAGGGAGGAGGDGGVDDDAAFNAYDEHQQHRRLHAQQQQQQEQQQQQQQQQAYPQQVARHSALPRSSSSSSLAADDSSSARVFVGFVSRFFYRHSILKLMEGMISRLRRTRFYVVIFVVAPPSDAEIHHVRTRHVVSCLRRDEWWRAGVAWCN
jgi:hypothetical protein